SPASPPSSPAPARPSRPAPTRPQPACPSCPTPPWRRSAGCTRGGSRIRWSTAGSCTAPAGCPCGSHGGAGREASSARAADGEPRRGGEVEAVVDGDHVTAGGVQQGGGDRRAHPAGAVHPHRAVRHLAEARVQLVDGDVDGAVDATARALRAAAHVQHDGIVPAPAGRGEVGEAGAAEGGEPLPLTDPAGRVAGGGGRRTVDAHPGQLPLGGDRKSTRLNSSHVKISYAVFCLKKKK